MSDGRARGGKARAERLSPERRAEIARQGGRERARRLAEKHEPAPPPAPLPTLNREALDAAIRAAGISKADLARQLGLPRQRLNDLLAGKRRIELLQGARLAAALRIPLTDLVTIALGGTPERRTFLGLWGLGLNSLLKGIG